MYEYNNGNPVYYALSANGDRWNFSPLEYPEFKRGFSNAVKTDNGRIRPKVKKAIKE